jgi:hypothetical protein
MRKVFLHYILGILYNLMKIKREEYMLSFEITKLQDEIDLGSDGTEPIQ